MPRVIAIRRYPVKSMGGESMASAELDGRGLVGDRAYAVVDAEGRLASGKNTRRMIRRDGVFAYSAQTLPDAVVASGARGTWEVGSPELDTELSAALAAPVRVLPEGATPYFDDGAVSLIGTATLDWCAAEWGVDADPRRLRANVVVETTEPFEEEDWTGTLGIGGAVLTPAGRVERCRTIDLPQDGVATRTRWLKAVGEHRELKLAIYLDVTAPGRIAVGDEVLR